MPNDADPRPPIRSLLRLVGALAVLAATASPALAQFTPRFRTLAPLTVNIGADPGKHSFVLADVNADGLPDIIAIEPEFSRVDVLLNQGNGAFDLVSTPNDGEITPTSVAVGDVGSTFGSDSAGKPDGKPDIIVGGDGGEVAVLYGRNDGQFDSPTPDEVIEPDSTLNIVGLVVGNFDESNSALDVALLDDDGVVLLCNDGNGMLSECSGDGALSVNGDFPSKIASGDFNGDSDLDVVVLNPDEQTIAILTGKGNGTFAEAVNVDIRAESETGESATDMTVARVDSDNLDDILAINSSTALAERFGAVVPGTTGRFRVSNTFILDFDATAITAGDFDATSERATDAIVGYDESSPSAVIGNGTGEFSDTVFTPSGAGQIGAVSVLASANVGGDTLIDFVALNPGGSQLRIAINTSNEATPTPGTTTPEAGTPTPTPTGPPQATKTATPTVTRTPTVTATNTPTPIPTANFGTCDLVLGGSLVAVASGNLDDDRLPDLVAADRSGKALRIVPNAGNVGTEFQPGPLMACAKKMSDNTLVPTATSVALGDNVPTDVAVSDLDGDGVDEIAVGTLGKVLILKRSDATWTIAAEVPVAAFDGAPAGNVTAIAVRYPNRSDDPASSAPIDINRDGVNDLVIANGSKLLTIVYGVRGQLPGRVVTQEVACPATVLAVADFDRQNGLDIAFGCDTRNASWLKQDGLNGGTSTFNVKPVFGGGTKIVGIAAGYLNNDGTADLLITRGDTSSRGESYLSANANFGTSPNGSFAAGTNAIGGVLGLFDSTHRRFDAVVASAGGELQFAYPDSAGGYPGPVVMPFSVHPQPTDIAVVNFDNDKVQDVALANGDGTLTVLVSSEPPATPTPTITLTPSVTPTATAEDTATTTPSDTPTASPTPTAVATSTATSTRTVTPGNTPTPTNTRAGFQLSSCAIGDGGDHSLLQTLLIGLGLASWRLLASRRPVATRSSDERE